MERERISRRIRRWVVDGCFAPATRLPAHRELARRLDAHVFIVQLALQQLAAEGFVELRGRGGTYVAASPPHTRRIALAFPVPWNAPGFVRFWTVLADEARRMKAAGEADFELYSCADRALADTADYRRLLDDVQKQRFMGILFASDPGSVARTAILTQPGIPRAAIVTTDGTARVTALHMAGEDRFMQRAVTLLHGRGRRRLAWLGVPGSHWEDAAAKAKTLGMEVRPHWVHVGHQGYPGPAAHLMRLLARLPAADRPDCLVITDDNLVEPACRGLLAERLRVPDDIEIVAHCNFPAPASGVPVHWLGYDIRNLLRMAANIMRRWRNGEEHPSVVRVPLEFEWEVQARQQAPLPAVTQEYAKEHGPC
ncbi:MAG: GntR family transcriptional regulator [Planctomycetota bacterium]|nr:GntR family transcriptional regulator [Planctomycetota bacterium]